MTQQERQERSRNSILQAAMEEFGTNDYDKVTMESICSRHGISKGMMYHYYSSKDELFLLCVQQTFQKLKIHVEREAEGLKGQNSFQAIKNFFMIRECFFECHPWEKRIFENAMLRPPEQLMEKIWELREPLRKINWKFMERVAGKMFLRPGLDKKKVVRYLESIEYNFRSIMAVYKEKKDLQDLHSMLELAEEVMDMVLFGVIHQEN